MSTRSSNESPLPDIKGTRLRDATGPGTGWRTRLSTVAKTSMSPVDASTTRGSTPGTRIISIARSSSS